MPLLIDRDPVARDLLIAAFLLTEAGELSATYLGRVRSGSAERLRVLRETVSEVTFLRRRPGAPADRDQGTKRVVIIAVVVGVGVALWIAWGVPALRFGADTWTTLVIGVAIVLLGGTFRSWAIVTLGSFFRREVTVEAGQTVQRGGPYRWLRHPSYTGTLVTVFGLGLAFGSWVGAVAAFLISLAGHLPRIRVEEAELREGLGDAYGAYASTTARLIPGLW